MPLIRIRLTFMVQLHLQDVTPVLTAEPEIFLVLLASRVVFITAAVAENIVIRCVLPKKIRGKR